MIAAMAVVATRWDEREGALPALLEVPVRVRTASPIAAKQQQPPGPSRRAAAGGDT